MAKSEGESLSDEEQAGESATPVRRQGRTAWGVLKVGCLGMLLLMCGLLSGLTIALQSGPANIQLPFSNQLRIGADDFVLSDFSFKDGNTYYLDLNGSGVRTIVQVEYLKDTHTLQLVLHHSTKDDRQEDRLLEMKLP